MHQVNGSILFVMMALPSAPGAAQVGGSAKSPFRLLKWLAMRVRSIHVIAAEGNTSALPPRCTGVVVRVGFARLFVRSFLQSAVIAFHLAVHGRRYSIVQSHHPHLSAGVALLKRFGIWRGRLIIKAHGTAVPEMQTNTYGGWRRFLLAINARVLHRNDIYALRGADFVICSSRFQKAEMRDLYGVPDEKLVVIYNGFDPDIRALVSDRAQQRTKRMVLCGRVVEKKNALYAVALYQRLKPSGLVDGLDLVLGHRNRVENRAVLSDIVSAISGDRSIEVHYDLEEQNLYRLYAEALFGVVPSIGYESIPSVIYEIASCDTPVFATGKWGIPEVLPQEYLLSLDVDGDVTRIEQVLTGTSEDQLHGAWAERFRYDRLVDQYIALYSEDIAT